jgi:hypothetical protein
VDHDRIGGTAASPMRATVRLAPSARRESPRRHGSARTIRTRSRRARRDPPKRACACASAASASAVRPRRRRTSDRPTPRKLRRGGVAERKNAS